MVIDKGQQGLTRCPLQQVEVTLKVVGELYPFVIGEVAVEDLEDFLKSSILEGGDNVDHALG